MHPKMRLAWLRSAVAQPFQTPVKHVFKQQRTSFRYGLSYRFSLQNGCPRVKGKRHLSAARKSHVFLEILKHFLLSSVPCTNCFSSLRMFSPSILSCRRGGLGSEASTSQGTHRQPEKAIVFSEFLEYLTLIEDQLLAAGIQSAPMYSPKTHSMKVRSCPLNFLQSLR